MEGPKLAEKGIAVLPFVNMSGSEEMEYFSDGITEEIINALTQIKQLKVTSRTSSFYFKSKNIPATQIAKELDVATILEASVSFEQGEDYGAVDSCRRRFSFLVGNLGPQTGKYF